MSPSLRMVMKLLPLAYCDYCANERPILYACMGATHCDFAHGCWSCTRHHIIATHPTGARFAIAEAT